MVNHSGQAILFDIIRGASFGNDFTFIVERTYYIMFGDHVGIIFQLFTMSISICANIHATG